MSEFRDVEAELRAAYPVGEPPPARHLCRRVPVVRRVLCGVQGVLVGLMSAILVDQAVGLATPVPMMVHFAIVGAWIWPDRNVLANRAIFARAVVAGLVALPFCWMPL